MTDRYFAWPPIAADTVRLTGPEAHHLLHVMRARPGHEVTLFDGSGAEFDAVVAATRRSELTLEIRRRRQVDRELSRTITLGVALPKGDRQKWLVEKLTELGVAELVPLATQRGVAQPTDKSLERLRRSVVEASKQCGRNRLMRIAQPQTWNDWIASVSDAVVRAVAHPGGVPAAEFFRAKTAPTAAISLAVGPEGGLTDEEIELAVAQGLQTIDLGQRILRVETAAIALAVLGGNLES